MADRTQRAAVSGDLNQDDPGHSREAGNSQGKAGGGGGASQQGTGDLERLGRLMERSAVPWARRHGRRGVEERIPQDRSKDADCPLPELLRRVGNSGGGNSSRFLSALPNGGKQAMKALITAYCACAICCGRAGGLTAWGTKPVPGVTVAAPRGVPFGGWVRIEVPGIGRLRRRVEDRTAKRWDGRWDVFMATHEEAQMFGIRIGNVKSEK